MRAASPLPAAAAGRPPACLEAIGAGVGAQGQGKGHVAAVCGQRGRPLVPAGRWRRAGVEQAVVERRAGGCR